MRRDKIKQIEKLRKQNWSYEKIGKKYGMTRQGVWDLLKKRDKLIPIKDKKIVNRDGGPHKLVEAVLMNYMDSIISIGSYQQMIRKADRKKWLEQQREWIAFEGFWFRAYGEYFGYDHLQLKRGFLEMLDEVLEVGGLTRFA